MPEDPASAIPRIYSLSESAEKLGVSINWLRNQLLSNNFDALRRANKWAMTEPQILAAIEKMTVKAKAPKTPPENPDDPDYYFSGLSPRSQTYWRNKEITGSTRRPGRQPKSKGAG